MRGLLLLALGTSGVAACGGGGTKSAGTNSEPPTPAPSPSPAPQEFADATALSNIRFEVGFTNFPSSEVAESTYGGTASGDCDHDGDIDLFITYGDGDSGGGPEGGGPNRLYLNLLDQGNPLRFQDVAETAGVAYSRSLNRNDRHSGPAFVDMDGDGHLDLFLGGIYGDPNRIYRNLGDCTFVDVTVNSPGIESMRAAHTISPAFGDYDLDGDLDMFLTHWGTSDDTYESPNPIETEHLWRNDSDVTTGIRFTNVSGESGVTDILRTTRLHYPQQTTDYTFTPTFARLDSDLWPDIVIAGDFGTSQALLNNGDGTFRDVTNDALRNAQYGMGSALGDIDFDGDLDWFVTSIFGIGDDQTTPWGNRLYRNDFDAGSGAWFSDITDIAGVANGRWGWAACFLDIDNDTDLDIYHTNGWSHPFLSTDDYSDDPSRMFVADSAGIFSEQAESYGLADTENARGVVCADFDEDGDTDLLQLTHREGNSATLWENRDAASGRNYLRLRLVGLPPNTAAAGARIYVTSGSREQMREVMIGNNYISQNPTIQIFGLNVATVIDQLRVEWPAKAPAPGIPPVQPPDTLLTPDLLSQAISTGTFEIRHPDLPDP